MIRADAPELCPPRALRGFPPPAPVAPLELVGCTPVARLPAASERLGIELFAKLETHNVTGSVKDRPARTILARASEAGLLRRGTTVVESSSGNFGVALAAACRARGLHFVCVTDPNATSVNQHLMTCLGAELQIVAKRDAQGGYLLERLERVEEILASRPGSFWPDQYRNPGNWESHYWGTGAELFAQLDGRLDYFFAAVSTGGTLTGCARYLKERDPRIRVVAVDPIGSVIFGGAPKLRHIPGSGASRVPELLDMSLVDAVVQIEEHEAVIGCHRLLREEALFVGGSAGLVARGIERYFRGRRAGRGRRPRVAAIVADRGERYVDSIYAPAWVAERFPQLARQQEEGHGCE